MSLPRYPKYKDSGVEWLGEVPEHWCRSALKFLGEYQNGYPFKPEDWGEEGLPIIRIAQLTGNAEDNFYNALLDTKLLVRKGDLLFSWSATIDTFIWKKGDAWLNQHIFKVTPTDEADKKFLFYLIKHVAPKLADFDAHGSTMRHIKKESLGQRVFVPSPDEQRQIVSFLDIEIGKVDALVEEQRRLIELLKEKRQAVISHAVTKGLNPNAPMKPSGVEWLGEVPEHWSVMPIKRVASIRYGIGEPPAYHDEGVPLIRATNVSAGKLTIEGMVYVDPEEIPASRIVWLSPGDIIVVRSGAYTGDSAIIPEEYDRAIAGFDMVLKCHSVRPEFVQLALLSMYLKDAQIDLERMRAAQPHLNAEELGSCVLTFPGTSEQDEIVLQVSEQLLEFDTLTSEARYAIDLLQERRSALISAAVTGKIDVRGLAKESAA